MKQILFFFFFMRCSGDVDIFGHAFILWNMDLITVRFHFFILLISMPVTDSWFIAGFGETSLYFRVTLLRLERQPSVRAWLAASNGQMQMPNWGSESPAFFRSFSSFISRLLSPSLQSQQKHQTAHTRMCTCTHSCKAPHLMLTNPWLEPNECNQLSEVCGCIWASRDCFGESLRRP